MKYCSRQRRVLHKLLKQYYLTTHTIRKVGVRGGTEKERETVVNQQTKPENIRKFHLTLDALNEKVTMLETRLKELSGAANKQKRKRIYQELAQVQKAIQEPQQYTKDPLQLQESKKRDQDRRIQKKKEKKKLLVQEIKRSKKNHKNEICLCCKMTGHIAADCRDNPAAGQVEQKVYQCYMCGSNEHALLDCPQRQNGQRELKFANCFVCNGVGHISRDCPQNKNGLYYKGGGCHICGGKDHYKNDCPKNPINQINNKRRNLEDEQYFSD